MGGHQTGQGKILKTTDGGQTWVSQAHGSTSNFYAVAFADANNGVTVTLDGEIFETTDGGAICVRSDLVTKNLYVASMVSTDAATVVGFPRRNSKKGDAATHAHSHPYSDRDTNPDSEARHRHLRLQRLRV